MNKKFKNLNEVRKSIDNVDIRLVKLIAEREFYIKEALKFKISEKSMMLIILIDFYCFFY